MKKSVKEKVSLEGIYTFTIIDALTGVIKRRHVYHNIIPTVGRELIANQLTAASPTNTPRVTHVALGSGTNVPANGDTTLQTEVYRNTAASRTNVSNVAYVTGFFSAVETTGTYREVGLFCNGTGTVDTGVLLSRVAVNITKSASETLTLDWTLTIS